MSQDKSPFKQVLDLALFGPLGLALSAKDAIPDWVDKGRTRAGHQVGIAKMVGEHASRHGQKVLTQTLVDFGLLPGPPPPAPRPTPTTAPRPAAPETRRTVAREAHDEMGGTLDREAPVAGSGGSLEAVSDGGHTAGFRLNRAAPSPNGDTGAGAREDPVADSDELAIPGYDSLSASQVVQRLAGLAPPELEAVRTYEAAGRGRRTILTKISQLQTGRA